MNEQSMNEGIDQSSRIDRRSMLLRGGVFAAMAGLGTAAVAQGQHEHHHHGGGKHKGLAATSHECLAKGEACIAHCMESFKTGDTSLAKCADSVLELMASCGALAKLAHYDSKHTAAMAGVAIEICRDCEAECRKHEEHPECKACADACARCIEECEKVSG